MIVDLIRNDLGRPTFPAASVSNRSARLRRTPACIR
ncbi:MAG: hypothetical protein IPL58_12340 [Betaproteobacteria bacterium]|uniref:Uncharacterized protein n=1 Tax=Candidatus Proximibacter danicus TaxID=2954365 RepID=A0A9D7K3I8_9PROT|nr:hypothetical protein [Candidatus Proximibacter danicus]